MNRLLVTFVISLLLLGCNRTESLLPQLPANPEILLPAPAGFPPMNPAVAANKPTQYGVILGEKLFHEKKLSGNNTISCASCHHPSHAFTDGNTQAIGIHNRVGLRNTPPLQNLAFMRFYNWDGNKLSLENQPLVPIISHEEMDSSMLDVIEKLSDDKAYRELFRYAFGDDRISSDRIFRSLAQFMYTMISANSKFDRVMANQGEKFTAGEARGYAIFQQKCEGCHGTVLFTDQTFRNVGFPRNPSSEEAGRARVTGNPDDGMSFRVPSLRNAGYTSPYGSFGQFATLREVLDYFDAGVLDANNLDPLLKANGNRIPLSEQEKDDLIAFIATLDDPDFVSR